MRALAALLAAGLSACAVANPVPPSPAGWAAFRVVEPVSFQVGVGVWSLPAGALFVANKVRPSDGAPIYCGQAIVNGQVIDSCIGYSAGAISPRALVGIDDRITIATASIEEFRLR